MNESIISMPLAQRGPVLSYSNTLFLLSTLRHLFPWPLAPFSTFCSHFVMNRVEVAMHNIWPFERIQNSLHFLGQLAAFSISGRIYVYFQS